MMDNEFIDDPAVNWDGQGLMVQLLRLPPNWVISLAHLSKVKHGSRRQATESALRNLREAGYVLRVDYRSKGRFQTEYVVFETKADREAWMAVNDVVDGQKFDYEPTFVAPDLSDPQDPGEPKPRKSRKAPKTEEELQAEAEAKEIARKLKEEEAERKKALKAEEKRLAKEKLDQENADRYKLFGSKERYELFNGFFWGTYIPNSGLDKPGMFYTIMMNNLIAGGEKYRHILMQFQQFEKQEAKKLENDRQNTIATERAKTLEQQNQPVQDQPEVTQETVTGQVAPKEFLRSDDLEWFESSNLKDDLLAGCIAELNWMKDHWFMHRQIISKYRKPQQARDLGLTPINN